MEAWNHKAQHPSIVALELKNDKLLSQHQAQGQMINSKVGVCKKNDNTDLRKRGEKWEGLCCFQ